MSDKIIQFPGTQTSPSAASDDYETQEEFFEAVTSFQWISGVFIGLEKETGALIVNGIHCTNERMLWLAEQLRMEALGLQDVIDTVYET